MTLYTSMPLEVVMDGIDREREPYQEVWAGNVLMQVEPLAPGVGKVVRLLQCELADYLNPGLAPGAVVHYTVTKRET